jgi:hypothetical protein
MVLTEEIEMEQALMRDTQRIQASRAAWLVATAGVLWVTRSGDIDDHVLARGERLAVVRGDDLVLQSWRHDQPAVWDWQAKPDARYGLRRGLLAWAWGRTARGLRAAAEAFAALARSAADRACRVQGSVAAGDVMVGAGLGR